MTSFMLKLVGSSLKNEVQFRRFTTSRPPKRATIDNWGYGAVLQGGVVRLVVGAAITLKHLAVFPFQAIRADIVQIQASDFLTFWEAVYYALVAKASRRKTIMRLGGAFDRFYDASPKRLKAAIRWAVMQPDRLIAQSDYWRELLAGLGRDQGVIVVPNWVPDSMIEPVERASSGSTCLFIAGSEARRKGIELVLDAARQLPDVLFRIVAAPDLPMPANVSPCGVLARAPLQDEMRRADIFLLPSFGEGFPNSLIEAMAVGLPAVATPVGAVPEIIADGVNGRLVKVGDAADLAGRIAELARDPAVRRRLGEQARVTVREKYCETQVIGRLRRLYRDLNSAS